MTTAWVIDSSIAFSWVHPTQATAETDGLLQEIEADAAIVVPVLWFAEVANSLLVLQRRKRLTAQERRTALETLTQMNPIVDDESGAAAFGRTSELAEEYGLSVYDAMYLELAIRRRLPLASRDGALNKAALKAGIQVL